MSYPDPFDERSPWDENPTPTTKENPPMTPASSNSAEGYAPFKIGFTLKAGPAFEAEWLTPTVYGYSAEETAKHGVELLQALKTEGLIDLTAKAAAYVRDQHKGSGQPGGAAAPKRFNNGRVEATSEAAPQVAGDDCPHGRSLVKKANWTALFCDAENKAEKCEPLWRQKDGSFKAN
ncbi:hypothetical protein AB0J38_41310 [Streptomyces sp. NPDC050095]|uniref:hypothetical protein n=1 Tax=unclassified Streptomyces TaxID=2593676 RepID=UPI00343F9ADD